MTLAGSTILFPARAPARVFYWAGTGSDTRWILVALPAICALKKRVDPRSYNGASFMGLKGLCIKSHGGTDGVGFANAIGVAAEMALIRFNEKIAQELESMGIGSVQSESIEEPVV